jgi:enoyl-[acyl-carrier protein] reductase III
VNEGGRHPGDADAVPSRGATCSVAVVTGGTRGIGRAISVALAEAGATVYAVFARDGAAADALSELAESRRWDIRCVRADLADEGLRARCVERIAAEVDHVDVIVHAAASGVHREVAALTPKHLAWTFRTNVLAIHGLLLGLLPLMPRGARLVGISSQGGTRAIPQYTAIGSSKGALESLFRHYAQELAPRGIAVNLVSPGLVLTQALEALPQRDERVRTARAQTPTGRLTTAEDVAAVVLFLCSPGAGQVIGQTLVVDGGRCLG